MTADNDADLLLLAMQAQTAKIRTALPGTVVSYDHATQTASVQLAVRAKVRAARGSEITNVDEPVIPNVPVGFLSGTGFAITFPLTVGNPVLVLVAERSIDEWKATGAASNDAQSVRRFDLSDAVCLPVNTSPARALGAAARAASALVIQGATIQLGSSSATDFVALASRVLAELQSLYTQLLAHTHATGVGPTGPALGVVTPPTSVAATKVKAE